MREAVYSLDLETAKAYNAQAGYGIETQAWSVIRRIRELDEFFDAVPGARDRLRETRAEVCFRSFRGAPLEASPRTPDGREERRELLFDVASDIRSSYHEYITTLTEPAYAPAIRNERPLLEAFIACLTAARPDAERATLPEAPPSDPRGLPMEIVYPTEAQQLTLAELS